LGREQNLIRHNNKVLSYATHSDWKSLFFTNLTSLLDDRLESCELALDDWIEVVFTNLWEREEVN